MSTSRKQDSANSENFLSQIWYKYFPYWPLFLFFIILSLGAAWYKLQRSKPIYTASASILIKDEVKGNSQSAVIEELNPIDPKNRLENQVAIIKSKVLMEEVVKKLDLYAPVFEEGRFVDLLSYENAPVKIISKNPDSISYANKVPFSYNYQKKRIVFDNKDYPLNAWVNTSYGILKFLPNYDRDMTDKKFYFSLLKPFNYADYFLGNLELVPTRNSAIIAVNIKDESPVRAANVVNELLKVYSLSLSREKQELAANTLRFVEARLKSVSHDLDSIERKIERLKSDNAVDLSAQGSMYLQNVNAADQKLGEVNSQLSILNTVESYVQSKSVQGGIVPSALGVNDPILSQLLDILYSTELQYEQLKSTTAENNPMMVSIRDQINKIKPSILENIQNRRKGLIASRSNLYSTSGNFSAMLQRIPQKEKDLINISREQNVKSNVYSFLLQKKEEAALSVTSTSIENKIIDKAVPKYGPVSPNKQQIYLIFIVIAFALSISLIVGNEIFNRKIVYRHEIESATSLPVIGEISFGKSKNLLITEIANTNETFIVDQFRKLRTSLTFLNLGAKRNKIVITSSIPGEGKSFVVANLGISLALAGKKVILLELDLINPTLATKLHIHGENGASNYLVGEKELDDVILKTKVHENLYLLPSGPLPENPSELLLSPRVERMLNQLGDQYDYILIDTAPLAPMPDAYVLSKHCDATLYVVRHKYTPKGIVQRIDEENKINELKNPAIIFNAVKNRGYIKNNFGYGYGYGHDYRYGYHAKDSRSRKKLTIK
ncbi:MAG: GumC family protein [Chitinophagaceae bacterium]